MAGEMGFDGGGEIVAGVAMLLSDSAGWLQTTYSIRFNRRHDRSGHLFQGRFKAHLVEADSYARQLLKYIHLNPVRPKSKRRVVPVERRAELSRYRWSSHRVYAGLDNTKSPAWLSTEWLSYFGRTRPAAQSEAKKGKKGDILLCGSGAHRTFFLKK